MIEKEGKQRSKEMEMYIDLDNVRLKQLVRIIQSVGGTVPFPIINVPCVVVDIKASNVPLFLSLKDSDEQLPHEMWMQ